MALIFDIERFSAKDGPGIRTVVFFKGCNMRCVWCHNPEGIHTAPELIFSARSCIACGRCAGVCPTGANSMSGGLHRFEPEKCVQCLACAGVCFAGALKKVGTEMTVDDVMREVEQDALLYRKSGGGVTLTGGEAMLQADFVRELLRRCRDSGISTALETNLNVPWERYEQILPLTDFLFVDVKHADGEKHREWTGVGNERILANFHKLAASGHAFAVRTPVIPGFNDTEADIETIAKLVSGAKNLRYYELLTYNPLGGSKGELAHPPEIRSFAVPARESMRRLAQTAASVCDCIRLDGNRIGKNDG